VVLFMAQSMGDEAEYRFLTSPNSNIRCRLVKTPAGLELQIFGNRSGLLSLANILLWFVANAWRREFLSLGELAFVHLSDQLAICVRLTDAEEISNDERHGTVRRLDQGALLEWVIAEPGLKEVALLIHRIASSPSHEYDRLSTGETSFCGIEIRMTDMSDWLGKGIA
jgi:hypothetical protein